MDSKLLSARINDLAFLCQKTNAPKFLGFLTSSETALATRQLGKSEKYELFGGYDCAQRTMLCFKPDWCDKIEYPIQGLTFTYRERDHLTHRDFLGALMALGINRETVGDILVEDGRAVVFAHNDVVDFITSQIDKIGNVGVTIQKGFCNPLPECGKKEQFTTTVASNRLDCVIAAICGFSRKNANDYICDGLVSVNSICCEKTTHIINGGDILAIRHKGKFDIVSCDEFSKKGRIILKYNKYV